MVLGAVALAGCGEREAFAPYDNTEERAAFYQRFNQETREKVEADLAELREKLAGEVAEGERDELEERLAALERRMERPDFFEFLEESDLPEGLVWEDGMDQPEIGSPEATKGGTLHLPLPGNTFPATIRTIGAEANGYFRGAHLDDVEMKLVTLHPNTGEVIPGLADRWAVAEDGQSVYFHIDPEARWSDGRDVKADDWMMAYYVYLSPYLTEPFYRLYVSEQFWGVAAYGDDYLCVRNASAKPMAALDASSSAMQAEFFREFGPDFEERYNWRPRPTTGAYQILEEGIEKGRAITLSRVKDWWARDRKYYRHRFNPDRIEYRLYRDSEKVFQLFLRGEIDLELLDSKKWYERTEIPKVFEGFIERATFYNEYPRPSFGLYLNTSKPLLNDRDVRIGLAHATNWQAVIDLDLRGDAVRSNIIAEGYDHTPTDIRAREFSIAKAREAFARAGFTERGKDGVLRNEKGQRLSFSINYARSPVVEPMLLRIKEEARRAGVEFQLDGMDGTSSFQQVSRKEHEITFAGWSHTPPTMDYYQYLHSKEAFEPGTRDPRPMTNNVTVFADPELDPVLERNRSARSWEEVRETSEIIERKVFDEAIWIPAFNRPFFRVAYWRWIQWPEDFNVRLANEPETSHVLWIDQELKEETLRVLREGGKFEEVERVYAQYAPEAVEEELKVEPAVEIEDGEVEP